MARIEANDGSEAIAAVAAMGSLFVGFAAAVSMRLRVSSRRRCKLFLVFKAGGAVDCLCVRARQSASALAGSPYFVVVDVPFACCGSVVTMIPCPCGAGGRRNSGKPAVTLLSGGVQQLCPRVDCDLEEETSVACSCNTPT